VGQGVVGTSTSAACVSTAQAQAINKIWHGQTANGTAPDPQTPHASNVEALGSSRLWWGLSRGAFLGLLAGDAASPPFFGPFPIAPDMVALELEDPRYATPAFVNATGSGENRWRDMTYADLAHAYGQGLALQPSFGHINTDNPNLTRVRDKGAKIVMFHGWGDQLIPPMGSIDYYTRLAAVAGGFAAAQEFDRLFMVPALGHCGGIGSVPGIAGPALDANHVPLPAPNQFFDALVGWVEAKTAPDRLVLRSADASVSLPVCPYPAKPVYAGAGAVTSEASYTCR
jgi:feruloyl esterase